MKSPITCFLLAATAALALVSCHSFKSMAATNVERLKNLRFPGGRSEVPPIVAVRKNDLKKVESGQEKILAWNRTRKSASPRTNDFPDDFDLSKLAVGGQLPASGILPSLNSHSDGTSINAIDPEASLPDEPSNLPPLPEEPTASPLPGRE